MQRSNCRLAFNLCEFNYKKPRVVREKYESMERKRERDCERDKLSRWAHSCHTK